MVYYVLVFAEMRVECYLHADLLGGKATLSEGMIFVDKLDCDDGIGLSGGNCFAYSDMLVRYGKFI